MMKALKLINYKGRWTLFYNDVDVVENYVIMLLWQFLNDEDVVTTHWFGKDGNDFKIGFRIEGYKVMEYRYLIDRLPEFERKSAA